ncbi:MAG: phloretin hydrolase [Clostridiales bacterium]|nr:phloretin hydrolase [Clostridiales bacterium]
MQKTKKKVGVSKEEKQLSYYRFFEQDMAPVPEEKLAILKHGQSEVKAVPIAQKNLFLTGEDAEYCQTGYGLMEDGTGFVCNATYMPGVTSEMLDWWFPWHSVGSDLRYKIWDPEEHYFARADRADYVCDPSVPVNQKTWGVSHYIIEDVGPGPDFLKLNFKRPKDFGYDETNIGTTYCRSLVCAVGEGGCPAAMTHKWYPYEDGVMFCSRFWIGMGYVNGEVVKVLPDDAKVPEIVPRSLFAHNIKEFTNLAAILPQVYAENKDNF